MLSKVQARIYKYVDNIKGITKVNNLDDIESTQEILNYVYSWQERNNMTWNNDKLIRVSHGRAEELHNMYLFTPNYNDPIPQKCSTKET